MFAAFERARERLGLIGSTRRAQLEALRKIESIGGIDLLKKMTDDLRNECDNSAVVMMSLEFGPYILLELRFGLEKREYFSKGSCWESKGIALAATPSTVPNVRFTNPNSWDDLDKHLSIVQLMMFSLKEKLDTAKKLAAPLSDYRYGQDESSEKGILDVVNYRIIYPSE
ncbi:MAG: hypothetical protein Q7R44_00480 [bacterium]|nr:hypothetical protein [bacterium]